ncbi:serine/threonine protein kinase [Chitinispirillales bacterium ANBcel5]|uniref:serine/threonine protein kinase n=1 Tax=Cellulosispirillum alkaliphilum TaxID=3039283 RepID=UPI002A58D24E|nr:serine/threonine protein kinase [Chitinispirillales bacterium ANBcel5]
MFENLLPETVLTVVEQNYDYKLTSLIRPLPSYINRVYELLATDNTKLVVKFYRPGRWSKEALINEHQFILDCAEEEIPVVAPLNLNNGGTLGKHGSVFFALFPKRSGRQLEITEESMWGRLGSLIARMHIAGEKRKGESRITIGPRQSATDDIEHLRSVIIPQRFKTQYYDTAMRIVELSAPLFENTEVTRIHGDCHRGNILDRLDEGFLLIDFDDMAMGPPVQDIWLLLPDRAEHCEYELQRFLNGYERFRSFDRATVKCIEPLRAMRMIYFLSWCSRQVDDFQFRKNFPDWGNDSFWQKEINDLREQMGFVLDSV